MEHMKRKLLMAGLSLTVAVVMVVTASMAWMTISTKPEVSGMQVSLYTKQTLLVSSNNSNYVQYLDISEAFKDLAPLHPTSTVDGIHWFIPTYAEETLDEDPDNTYDGQLNGISDFKMETYSPGTTMEHGNVSIKNLSGDALRVASEKGYYVYADFWIKTEEEACKVRLSVPESKLALQDGEAATGLYGSYVLAGEEQMTVNDDRSGGMSLREAESCVRVGFLFEDPETNTQKFIIYEPNADQRSSSDKPTDHIYVHGYEFKADEYTDGSYIKTQPIGLKNASERELKNLDPEQLIIQKKSAWGTGAAAKFAAGETPGSNEVDILGKFISPESIYGQSGTAVPGNVLEEDIASDVILHLEENTPVKITMFIWLEGQDVDCWNDVSAGSFIVNLELAGETVNN